MKTTKDCFLEKIDKRGPYPSRKACMIYPEIKRIRCWSWLGGGGRYGQLTVNCRSVYAHRFSYELAHGEGSLGKKQILHKCDNGRCVNPLHLIKGTAAENIFDRDTKGRTARPKGEKNTNAKFTNIQVKAIRDLWEFGEHTQKELAKKFGVTCQTIANITNGRAWRHL
jgi:DNA-binding XRE family transcriptional regulator